MARIYGDLKRAALELLGSDPSTSADKFLARVWFNTGTSKFKYWDGTNIKTIVASGDILDADINASAAIAVSKLAALTVSRALVSSGAGIITPATTTAIEIGYVNLVTSPIQSQIDSKTDKSTLSSTGDIYYASSANTPARRAIGSEGQVLQVSSGIPVWGASPATQLPAGLLLPWSGRVAPTGYLLSYGQELSRVTYADIYNNICPVLGTFTVTIASPGVVTLNSHNLNTGERIRLSTSGALPTGLAASTDYYVIFVSTNTFRLATSLANALAGTAINTTGSQSGTHTAQDFAWGAGDGSTTFNAPDMRGRGFSGRDNIGGTGASRLTFAGSTLPGDALGGVGGDQRLHAHTHIQDTHNHTQNAHVHGIKNSQGAVTEPSNGTAQGVAAFNTAGSGYVTTAAGAGVPFIESITPTNITTVATNQTTGAGATQNVPPIAIGNWIIKI